MKYYTYILDFIFYDIPIHFINLITGILPNHIITNKIRGWMMRPFFGGCGKGLQIGKNVIINNPKNLYLGDDCYISHFCYIQAKGNIMIENNVILGPMSVLATSNHIFENGIVLNKGSNKPISIGKGTWCGGHVIILAGVKVGRNVKIGAGAVITKDTQDNVMITGIPGRVK